MISMFMFFLAYKISRLCSVTVY